MWDVIHLIASLAVAVPILVLSSTLWYLGIISPRVDNIVCAIIFVIVYMDDTHIDAPIAIRTLDLFLILLFAYSAGKGGPKRPRKRVLKKLGAKGKAALAKLKASMPKVTVPRLAPSPA